MVEYVSGTPIADILWRMRLRTYETLGHYLQEVVALTSLASLPAKAGQSIALAAGAFPAVARALSQGKAIQQNLT